MYYLETKFDLKPINRCMRFKEFLLKEDMMGGPPGGGMGGPPMGGPPGGDPMGGMPPGGGMGGPPGMGGDPMGGGMGGPPGGGGQLNPQVNLQLKSQDVWTVLDEILNGKKAEKPDSKDQGGMVQSPNAGLLMT